MKIMAEEEKKYRVGVIGVGRQGSHHARAYALNPRCAVVAGAATDAENLAVCRHTPRSAELDRLYDLASLSQHSYGSGHRSRTLGLDAKAYQKHHQ